MKKARVLYRKGIHNFEPRTPYQTSGMFKALPTSDQINQYMYMKKNPNQFNNEGVGKGINLGGNSDMNRYNVNKDYITTSSTSSGDNLKKLNEMYKLNNSQIPTLTPADKKNIMDYMYKSDYSTWMKSKDDDLIKYYFDKQKKNGGYMMAQMGKQFYPEYEQEIRNQRLNNMIDERSLDSYDNSLMNEGMEEGMQQSLNPEILKDYMDRQAREDDDFYNSFYQAPHKNYENPFFKYPRKKGQLGTDVQPVDNSKMDPFKINQTEQPESYMNNDMYNRAYNIKYDLQGRPMEPSIPFEKDPFSEQWVEYNKALKDYYNKLENDPNKYSHMKKGLRPKMRRPMKGYGGFLNEIRYGR